MNSQRKERVLSSSFLQVGMRGTELLYVLTKEIQDTWAEVEINSSIIN